MLGNALARQPNQSPNLSLQHFCRLNYPFAMGGPTPTRGRSKSRTPKSAKSRNTPRSTAKTPQVGRKSPTTAPSSVRSIGSAKSAGNPRSASKGQIVPYKRSSTPTPTRSPRKSPCTKLATPTLTKSPQFHGKPGSSKKRAASPAPPTSRRTQLAPAPATRASPAGPVTKKHKGDLACATAVCIKCKRTVDITLTSLSGGGSARKCSECHNARRALMAWYKEHQRMDEWHKMEEPARQREVEKQHGKGGGKGSRRSVTTTESVSIRDDLSLGTEKDFLNLIELGP
jgi:hypothetical protein